MYNNNGKILTTAEREVPYRSEVRVWQCRLMFNDMMCSESLILKCVHTLTVITSSVNEWRTQCHKARLSVSEPARETHTSHWLRFLHGNKSKNKVRVYKKKHLFLWNDRAHSSARGYEPEFWVKPRKSGIAWIYTSAKWTSTLAKKKMLATCVIHTHTHTNTHTHNTQLITVSVNITVLQFH
jgi:hypothetical protein